MEDIIWLCAALIAALVAVAVVVARFRHRPQSIERNPGRCSSCETPMSLRRVSIFRSHSFGEWVCPHCGTRMDKKRRVARTAS
jgi:uncharacterized protein with PIN domain